MCIYRKGQILTTWTIKKCLFWDHEMEMCFYKLSSPPKKQIKKLEGVQTLWFQGVQLR